MAFTYFIFIAIINTSSTNTLIVIFTFISRLNIHHFDFKPNEFL